ncbi:hypothetical protein FSP39_022280 [Pinctada imbricata]|uniref:Uncharacterized protein n=1 Tax=Pinctada imbricata TaxID=66713 RepID=A0AA89BZR6_PINIB|nr:hypothetical protein FSP39_022280 [Pinctada imbricata]
MEPNVTTTSPTLPRPDFSLPIQERDTYLLIGTFVSVLILMGILMAFMHKNCRNSLLRWRTWLIHLRHSNAMSTRRPRSDVDMTLDLSNPECPVYSKEIHVSSAVKTSNQNQRIGSAGSKRHVYASSKKEDGEDSGISIISSSRDGKTISLPSQQSLNMNLSFERGINTRDLPCRNSYLSLVSCKSSDCSRMSEIKDKNGGYLNNSFSVEDEQKPFDLHKSEFYLPDSSDFPSDLKPSWNYEVIVPSKIEYTGMASSRSKSANDISIVEKQQRMITHKVKSFSHEGVHDEINEALHHEPRDKHRHKNRSPSQRGENPYFSRYHVHSRHKTDSRSPPENFYSRSTSSITHASKQKQEKDIERCPSEHSGIYVSDHRYKKKGRASHNRDTVHKSNTKISDNVIPSFQSFEELLKQRRRRLSRDSAIDQSDYSFYKSKPKVVSNPDGQLLVSSRIYKSEPNIQIHLNSNNSTYKKNRPVSQMSSLSLEEIQSRKRKGT